jgi:sigma-B regulation protein RsbU (phosphoserine phosphatase)
MQDLYKDIPCIYFSACADGRIIEANETLRHALGYTSDELAGRNLESIFTVATRIFQQTHFYPLLQLKGHVEEIYITLNSKDGEDVPVLMNAVRKEKDGQSQFHFAGIVVNKRKKYEDEIIAAKKAAEKALSENTALKAAKEELQNRAEELDRQFVLANQQNHELRQFSHLATHTLQEPVRKLLFFSSQILRTNEEAGTAAHKIRQAAEDLDVKLKGLQQYIWLTNEELKWEVMDLALILESARKEVELENPGVSILLESEAIPAIEANRVQMLFLMKELLNNAVRFRKPGSVVNVRIHASTLLLNMFRKLTGKYKYTEFVKLQIQDNGIGFDDTYQAQAFELFRKLHSISGAGIGLALCKKIVDNHSGSISLESQQDTGTTVIVFLPLQQFI